MSPFAPAFGRFISDSFGSSSANEAWTSQELILSRSGDHLPYKNRAGLLRPHLLLCDERGLDPALYLQFLKKVGDIRDYNVVVLEGGETHSSFTYMIQHANNLRLTCVPDSAPEDIAHDLRILLAEN